MQIVDAQPVHAPGIAAIYNDAVAHTTAVWNEQLVGADNRAAWLADRQAAGFPVLVALGSDDGAKSADEVGTSGAADGAGTSGAADGPAGTGEVLGYATYGPWRAFDGYRHTVEHSVYVRGNQRGKGLGRTLMEALLERAAAQGIHVMVAGIEAGNTGSLILHEKLGFEQVGHLPQVGTKFGKWLDLTFLQLMLDDRRQPDAAPA